MKQLKIVFLDAKTIGNCNLQRIEELGELTLYSLTNRKQTASRIADADIVLTNKVIIDIEELNAAKNLKLICVTATGTNNINITECSKRGITVKNCVGYSTFSVAQITFSSILSFVSNISYYDNFVKSCEYSNSQMFTDMNKEFHEIYQKKFCIVGLGNIGSQVYKIASDFGCFVSYYSTSGKNVNKNFNQASFDEMLQSDIISIHCGLNEKTKSLFNATALSKMKKSAIIANFGRGGVVCEQSVADAISSGNLAGYICDVFETEPIQHNNPLLELQDLTKVLFTPHIAWASIESRERLIKQVEENIRDWGKLPH